jgi:hypothetical protein
MRATSSSACVLARVPLRARPSASSSCIRSSDVLPPLTFPPIANHAHRDPTPVECNYTGLRFVSKQALDYAAKAKK